jgi:hypothetical protein
VLGGLFGGAGSTTDIALQRSSAFLHSIISESTSALFSLHDQSLTEDDLEKAFKAIWIEHSLQDAEAILGPHLTTKPSTDIRVLRGAVLYAEVLGQAGTDLAELRH